jgi:hypothetical protein
MDKEGGPMAQQILSSATTKRSLGWTGVFLVALTYVFLYGMNLWLPLGWSNYTSRIWDWTQATLTLVALAVVIMKRQNLPVGLLLSGFALGTISAFSHSLHDPDVWGSLKEGFGVLVCFSGGAAIFRNLRQHVVLTFQGSWLQIGRSLLIGMALAIPLAAFNNFYFYMNSGSIQFTNWFYSAIEALSPAIHEEIIFRFFILALVYELLKELPPSRWITVAAVVLAVVPHSLNHLPDLFLQNPVMALVLLAATSLLFGLPMAMLQIRRNLESAIAFHWFIDFARFLFGF